MSEELKENWVRVQVNPELVVCLDGKGWDKWLFTRGVDGRLVSSRKLSRWELMQVEDQRCNNIVFDGGHNIQSKSGGVRCG